LPKGETQLEPNSHSTIYYQIHLPKTKYNLSPIQNPSVFFHSPLD
jgi:hypothetical protein